MLFRQMAATSLVALLTACGGGGGGGPEGPAAPAVPNVPAPNPEGTWLSFDPPAPTARQFEGESMPITVNATSTRTFSAPFNVAIIDPGGVILPKVVLVPISELRYQAQLSTSPSLPAGDHKTTLEIRVCEDAPLTCNRPFPGSPWRLPLTVHVVSKAEAISGLTLSVPSVALESYPGESVKFKLEAQVSGELASRDANIGIFDPAGMTEVRGSQSAPTQGGKYTFDVSTRDTLGTGTHTTNLEVRMCQDAIERCTLPVAGSPWIVPLTVRIKSPTNLSSLNEISGLEPWSTYQGNAAHTGFVRARFDPAAFSRRWKLESVYSQELAGSVAVADGRVFVTRWYLKGWETVAVSEDRGDIVWKAEMGNLHRVNAPAVGNGRVYVTSADRAASHMWVFDQNTGALVRKVGMTSQGIESSAATVVGTDVYSVNGYDAGIGKFSDATGTFAWYSEYRPGGWMPASDGKMVYAIDGQLRAIDAASGKLAYSIGEPSTLNGSIPSTSVVLGDDQMAYAAPGFLMAYDLKNRRQAWRLGMRSSGIPAYGNGTVYAFGPDGNTLGAYDPKTGDLRWAAELDGEHPFSNLVVTENLAFVSSKSKTSAIDLETRKTVWTYPAGGSLAISPRGVLFILGQSTGMLAAVNLR